MARFDNNLVVIGGGSAGLIAALIGATLRARVTLIEKAEEAFEAEQAEEAAEEDEEEEDYDDDEFEDDDDDDDEEFDDGEDEAVEEASQTS